MCIHADEGDPEDDAYRCGRGHELLLTMKRENCEDYEE
jgi:hypothetical protein